MHLPEEMKRRLLLAVLIVVVAVDNSTPFIIPFTGTKESIQPPSRLRASSFESCVSRNPDSRLALNELLSKLKKSPPENHEQALAFLFVGNHHAKLFPETVQEAAKQLGKQTKLLALVGGGVVGGGNEIDNPSLPAMSLLYGILPPNSQVHTFSFTEESLPSPESWKNQNPQQFDRPPSYLVFADPFSPIERLLRTLDSSCEGAVIAGGISVPLAYQPTVAMDGVVMPQGSAVGVALSGNIGLQAIVAQGCRPVGPAFSVTSTSGKSILLELNGKPALAQLEKVAENADEQAKELMRSGWLLCGISSSDNKILSDGDYLIRQITGFQPRRGAIVVQGGEFKVGDTFRFHVREPDAARDDMAVMVQRAKTERLFVGPSQAGSLVAAIQVSCVARGISLFGTPNADLGKVQGLFDDNKDNPDTKPVAGFFANGEIGPVGTRIGGFDDRTEPTRTHMHGFTTVVALLCDYSEQITKLETSTNSVITRDDKAWG